MQARAESHQYRTYPSPVGELRSLFAINEQNFETEVISLFKWQAASNPIYKQYLTLLNIAPQQIQRIEEIPFLPIGFFKSQTVVSGHWKPEATFLSSHTTGNNPSKHLIRSVDFYHNVAIRGFERYYGSLQQYHLLIILPAHISKHSSSLMSMVVHFAQKSESPHSGVYSPDDPSLQTIISLLQKDEKRRILLWGTAYGLMDLAEKHTINLTGGIVMETGGMKGRREEITREELHQFLSSQFSVKEIHSEYGMAELLSQCYAPRKGHFRTPPWVKIQIRDPRDPFTKCKAEEAGGINIIDLANSHSCAFIETEDIGMMHKDGSFEVLGRLDAAEVRGCNLLHNK